MKKLFAIVLISLFILSSAVIPAGAALNVPTYAIEYGQTVTVQTNDSRYTSFALIEFIPAESGKYALTSSSDNDICDPYCVLYDGKRIEILEENDDFYDLDFCLEYDFEAGKLYYFMVYDFDRRSVTFDVTLGCAHDYGTDGLCKICSEECSHIPVYDYFGYCRCGNSFAGTDIRAGDSLQYKYDEENDYNNLLSFIPDSDGAYIFYSQSKGDYALPGADLYSEEDGYLAYCEYPDDEDNDFVLIYEFEKGKEYFIYLSDTYENEEGFTLFCEKATHPVLGGGEHTLIYEEGYYSSCTEEGRTNGLYCPECDEYTYGHEVIPPDGHWDINGDGICEICKGDTPLPDCSHICHSRHPVLQTIWKIINFFNKLLSINYYCECGTMHI